MVIKKIITHNGLFHADEVFAIALLFEVFGNIPIVERTRTISDDDMHNPDIWILDVGGKLQPELNNYDHHTFPLLQATNMQVLAVLLVRGHISNKVYDELYSKFDVISDIDRRGYDGFNGFQVNSLIKSLNGILDGWHYALDVARAYIRSAISTVELEEKSREIWDNAEDICFGVKLCNDFPVHWKRYNESPFLISPNKTIEGQWKLHSIDSRAYPLVRTGKELFFHEAKFLAIYSSKEDAIEAGRAQALNIFG